MKKTPTLNVNDWKKPRPAASCAGEEPPYQSRQHHVVGSRPALESARGWSRGGDNIQRSSTGQPKALSSRPSTTRRVPIDLEAAKTWIYPVNYPVREYQLQIVTESLFRNTLVSLPTGLGKTLIAAVVMYNFYRW